MRTLNQQKFITLLLILVALALSCVRKGKDSKGPTPPNETESKVPEPDRPTEEGEGISGYLTDPGAIAVTNFGRKLAIHADPGVVVAREYDEIQGLEIGVWATTQAKLGQASVDANGRVDLVPELLGKTPVKPNGSFDLEVDWFADNEAGKSLVIGLMNAHDSKAFILGDREDEPPLAFNSLSSVVGTRSFAKADFEHEIFKAGLNYSALGANQSGLHVFDADAPADITVGGGADAQFDLPSGLAVSGEFLFVADSNNNRVQRFETATGRFAGWVGLVAFSPDGGAAGCRAATSGLATPGWCTGGGALPGDGDGDGSLIYPTGIALVDEFLYVVDNGAHSVLRFESKTGRYSGWLGQVDRAPEAGGTLCATAREGAPTPGWCHGGRAKAGASAGALSAPWSLTADNDYLYVGDRGNSRVARFVRETGESAGWIGAIHVVPTGGAEGCTAAVPGTATPGWCAGGEATSGSGDGMLMTVAGIAADSTYLYVADAGLHRIVRFAKGSGVFAGWTGLVAETPLRGSSGCNNAKPGTATPGWCFGGKSAAGSADGALRVPLGLALDAETLAVADSENFRVARFDIRIGSFRDWLGAVSDSPATVADGCLGAESITPGFCRGGQGAGSRADGGLARPYGIAMTNGILYIADGGNNRVNRHNGTTRRLPR